MLKCYSLEIQSKEGGKKLKAPWQIHGALSSQTDFPKPHQGNKLSSSNGCDCDMQLGPMHVCLKVSPRKYVGIYSPVNVCAELQPK